MSSQLIKHMFANIGITRRVRVSATDIRVCKLYFAAIGKRGNGVWCDAIDAETGKLYGRRYIGIGK